MRNAFIKALTNLAAQDERVFLLTADLGFTVLEEFQERYPDRFINVGVAEQNMLGVAAGLAKSGYLPFAYSIATFASMRGYEFFRNGAISHQLPVRVISVGGGFEYGAAGNTHHALEDIAIMRTQPGLEIYAPADAPQAEEILLRTAQRPAPIYYRLGKNENIRIANLDSRFTVGEVEVLQEGSDILFLATGAVALQAQLATLALAGEKVSAGFAVLSSIAPCDMNQLASLLGRYRYVVTVEEHFAIGGIGSLVAECIAERGVRCQLSRAAVRDRRQEVGSQDYLCQQHGLAAEQLVSQALAITQGG